MHSRKYLNYRELIPIDVGIITYGLDKIHRLTYNERCLIVGKKSADFHGVVVEKKENTFESMYPYGALAVANYFIDKAKDGNVYLDLLKIIKLVYIAQGWSLAIFERKAFFAEEVEAWSFGPVIPSVYHNFKEFSNQSIDEKAVIWGLSPELDEKYINEKNHVDAKELDHLLNTKFEMNCPTIKKGDKDAFIVLDRVWSGYSNLSSVSLIDLTHQHDTPWNEVYRSGQRGIIIKKESIQNYFIKELDTYFGNTESAQVA